jgi:hypothetical protein
MLTLIPRSTRHPACNLVTTRCCPLVIVRLTPLAIARLGSPRGMPMPRRVIETGAKP